MEVDIADPPAADLPPPIKRPRSTDDLIDLDHSHPYSIDAEPLSRGAEATITRCIFLGRPAVRKERLSKAYRHPDLDKQLLKERMKAEVKGLQRCKTIGVEAPSIYFLSEEKNLVILEEIQGATLRDHLLALERSLDAAAYQAEFTVIGEQLGKILARMHMGALIHGDLTSANVMLRDGDAKKLVLFDFGLCYTKDLPEDKAVDLYVFERALSALHNGLQESTFDAIKRGYISVDATHGEIVYKKLDEVRLRGRKRDMTG
uniref:non-specific serine/threonine protein kinase n=1 Tax=Panagrellus redivivus TaxID=6233 RepID=A0A7E4UZI6_PANRE